MNTILIQELKKIATTSTHPKVWVASALVYKNTVISYGVNQLKSHPYQRKYGKNTEAIFWHSETSCIYNAKKLNFSNFHRSILYIVRIKWDSNVKKNLILGLAKPCIGCLECIKDNKIKTVIYSKDEKFNIQEMGILNINYE